MNQLERIESPFSIDAVLGFATKTTFKNFWILLCVHLATGFIPGILGFLIWRDQADVIAFLLRMPLMGGWTLVLLKVIDGEKPTFSDLFSRLGLLFRFMETYIVGTVLWGGGLICLIVPGVIAILSTCFYGPLLVEQNCGPIDAFRRSAALTRGYRWKLLGTFTVLIVMGLLITLGTALLVTIPAILLHIYANVPTKDFYRIGFLASCVPAFILWEVAYVYMYRQLTIRAGGAVGAAFPGSADHLEFLSEPRQDERRRMHPLTVMRIKLLSFSIGVFLALIGLIAVFLAPSQGLLFAEGLLLYVLGRALKFWMRPQGAGNTPILLFNPLKRLALSLLNIAWRLGGLFLILLANQTAFWVVFLGSFILGWILSSTKSEAKVIRDIVTVYKSLRSLRPDLPEKNLLELTARNLLRRWNEPSYRIDGIVESASDKGTLNDLVTYLLIHRDTTTGTNYIPDASDIRGFANMMQSSERREQLIASYLGQPPLSTAEEKHPSPDAWDHAFTLGRTAFESNNVSDAERHFKEALQIAENLELEPLAVGLSLNSLAQVYVKQNKLADAEPLFLRSLEIFEKMPSDSSFGLAVAQSNLARLYKAKNMNDEARPLFGKTIALRERITPDDVELAYDLNSLAELEVRQNNLEEAQRLSEKALKIAEKALGEDNPYLSQILDNLGLVYGIQSNDEASVSVFERLLVIQEKHHGAASPKIVGPLNNLASAYDAAERYNDAEELCVRALAIQDKLRKPDYLQMFLTLQLYEKLLRKAGRTDDATLLEKRSKKIRDAGHLSHLDM